jgi:hypothetical protein
MKGRDIDLIGQLENYERDDPADVVWEAAALIKDLVAALRFYAAQDNWKEQETGIGMHPSDAERDGGSRARAALANVESRQ